MGMYTEINVCFDLCQDVPKEIVDILHCLIDGDDEPSVLPQHDFFKCDRWNIVACCDSGYFGGSSNSKIISNTSGTWLVNIRANLKNYDSEIEKFLDWLTPYVETHGFIGYTRYEECENPKLVYIENGKVILKNVNVKEY